MRQRAEFPRGDLEWLLEVMSDIASQERQKAKDLLSDNMAPEDGIKAAEHNGYAQGIGGAQSLVRRLLDGKRS